MAFRVPNKYRVRSGELASGDECGNNGAFMIPYVNHLPGQKDFSIYDLGVIASDGDGWEHVSVSLQDRTPTWEEMCFIKRVFWGSEDVVMQIHPKEEDYVNNHPYTLHLWRPKSKSRFKRIPIPPKYMV